MPKIVTDEQLLETGPSGDPRWLERERARIRNQPAADEDRKARDRRLLQEQLDRLKSKITGGK
jgi:hypothetical protein